LVLAEEGSLFPRLSTRRPELAEQLAEVAAGHPAQVKLQDQIAELAAALDGESRQGAHKDLLEAATALAQAHHARVARLDHVFAIAKAALTVQDDADIAAEMEKRRDRRDESDQSDDPVPVSRRERSETIAERPVAKRAVAKRAVAKRAVSGPASTKRVAATKKQPKPAPKAAKTASKSRSMSRSSSKPDPKSKSNAKPDPKPKPTSKQVVKTPAPTRRPPKPRAATPRR
jgi:hypothetical protein